MRYEVLLWAGSEVGSQLDLHADLREAASLELEADSSDTLQAIAERAKTELGVNWPWTYFHFVSERDTDGRRYQEPYLSAYLADDGGLLWTVPQLEGVTVEDVVRTKGEGLFEGDAYALLIEEPLGGDGVLANWDDVLTFLRTAVGLYGAHQFTRVAIDDLRKVIEQVHRNWEAVHARPDALLFLVRSKTEWDYVALARYLRISGSACVSMLESLGYEQQQEGGGLLYRLAEGPEETQAFLREFLDRFAGGDPIENRASFRRIQGRPDEEQ